LPNIKRFLGLNFHFHNDFCIFLDAKVQSLINQGLDLGNLFIEIGVDGDFL